MKTNHIFVMAAFRLVKVYFDVGVKKEYVRSVKLFFLTSSVIKDYS
jgi:hypothetical protein